MILLTGSSGFIGSNFINYFIERKLKFIGLDKIKNPYINSKYLVKVNILNKKKLDKIFKKHKPKSVIHLAANSGLNFCHMNRVEAFKNNIEATLNLLQLCNKYKCQNILVASSMAAEKFDLIPSFYGFTKISVENLFKTYRKTFGINASILRLSNIFGPFSVHKNSAIHEMIKCIYDKKKVFNIHGTGKQKRDFLYSKDLVTKILKISQKKDRKLVYNLKTNRKYSINQVFSLINNISKSIIRSKKIDPPKGYDVTHVHDQNLKINKSFIANMKKTINWYNKYL